MARITDPALNAFVYHILYNGHMEDREKLPPKFAGIIGNEKLARKFATNASFEQKLELLIVFGLKFYMLISPEAPLTMKEMRAIIKNNKAGSEILEDAIKMKVIAISNRQLAKRLAAISDAVHSELYEANLSFLKKPYHENGWSKSLGTRSKVDVTEEWKGYAVQFNLKFAKQVAHSDYSYDLTMPRMYVMMELYESKETYVPYRKIVSELAGVITRTEINVSLKKLADNKHISKIISPDGAHYSLTGQGTMIIDKITGNLSKTLRR